MSSAPHGVFDFKAVGEVYRERLGGNPFGIEPNVPPRPLWECGTCGMKNDPNTGEVIGKCNGRCCY